MKEKRRKRGQERRGRGNISGLETSLLPKSGILFLQPDWPRFCAFSYSLTIFWIQWIRISVCLAQKYFSLRSSLRRIFRHFWLLLNREAPLLSSMRKERGGVVYISLPLKNSCQNKRYFFPSRPVCSPEREHLWKDPEHWSAHKLTFHRRSRPPQGAVAIATAEIQFRK